MPNGSPSGAGDAATRRSETIGDRDPIGVAEAVRCRCRTPGQRRRQDLRCWSGLVAALVAVAPLALLAAGPQPAHAEAACGGAVTAPSPSAAIAAPSGGLAWIELPPMPRPRSELGAAAVGGVIYAVGGFGASLFEPGGVGGEGVDCFDTRSGAWGVAADLPAGVHHPGVAPLDGRVYVAGGYDADGAATAAVWAYDPATDGWDRRADLPTPRGALGLAALDGRLYAVGGARQRLGGPVTGAVEVYDPAADAWTPAAPLPTPREHLAVAAGDGRVFAIGGRANGDEGDAFAAAAEAFDPTADRWETLPPLPTPRGGVAGAVVAGHLAVLGGERGTRTYDDAEAYDPATRTWSPLPPLPTARHGVAAAAIGNTLYAVAGSTRAGTVENTGALEALTLTLPA